MTKKELVKRLDQMIRDQEQEIILNLINCGSTGPALIAKLETAGYSNATPGHPQPIFRKVAAGHLAAEIFINGWCEGYLLKTNDQSREQFERSAENHLSDVLAVQDKMGIELRSWEIKYKVV